MANETEEFEFRLRAEQESKGEPDKVKTRTIPQELLRQAGMTGRNALEAGGSVPAMLGNAMEYMGVKGAGGNIGTTISDKLGLPKPEGMGEVLGNELAKTLVPGTGGYNAAVKAGTSVLPKVMANRYGASAVGGAGAGAASAQATNENPIEGAALGAAMGPVGTVVGNTGGWIANKRRRVFEDAETQAVRKLKELVGDDGVRQAAILRALRPEVQGERVTSGLAATVDPKMAYQKEFQERARRRLSGEYTDLDKANEAAWLRNPERIARQGREGVATQGGVIPQSANELRRSSRTNPLYAESAADRITMTPELEALVAGREVQPAVTRGRRAFSQEQTNAEVAGQRVPSGPVPAVPATPAMPEARDSFGMLTREAVPEVPGTPGNRSVQDLQQVSKELSDRINRIKMSDPEEAYRLSVARNQLTGAMREQSPKFAEATNVFRQFSQPQNQADIAEVLTKALRNSSGDVRPGTFLRAIDEAPQTIKKAGVPRFSQIEQVMTPTQMKQINAVARSLRRQEAYSNIGRTELPGVKSGAEELENIVPGLFDKGITLVKKFLRNAGVKMDEDMLKVIDEATLNPEKMAQLLERVPPNDRIKFLSAIREGNPKGASIGLVAGQE